MAQNPGSQLGGAATAFAKFNLIAQNCHSFLHCASPTYYLHHSLQQGRLM
jgi:hypothetical protein